jgi:phosphoenolpyruvate carboxykinase (GTP)
MAMLVPPEQFKKRGYRVWTIGDDIAWLRIDEDGNLRAMNPEAGIFGVAPGTNSKSNLNALVASQKNAIFTNVLLKKDRTVWWEDADGPVPPEGTNWQGNAWFPGMMDGNGRPITGAHPNSRFTAPLTQCPSFSEKYFDPLPSKLRRYL